MKKMIALVAALVVGIAAIVAGMVWDHQRNSAIVSDAKSRETPYTPPEAAEPLLVAAIGDSFTAGSGEGGSGGKGWSSLAEKRLYSLEQPIYVTAHAKGGVGYQAENDSVTFGSLVDNLSGSEDVVVIFGSVNDRFSSDLPQAVAGVVARVNQKSPQAAVLVVGPAWTELRGSDRAQQVSDAVRAGTGSTTYVDASSWFEGRDDLVGGDRVHPTDAGHEYLADQLTPLIAAELGINVGDPSGT